MPSYYCPLFRNFFCDTWELKRFETSLQVCHRLNCIYVQFCCKIQERNELIFRWTEIWRLFRLKVKGINKLIFTTDFPKFLLCSGKSNIRLMHAFRHFIGVPWRLSIPRSFQPNILTIYFDANKIISHARGAAILKRSRKSRLID